MTTALLPEEIVKRMAFHEVSETTEIFFALKATTCRSDAWDACSNQEGYDYKKNPWRRMHTQSYWAWYKKENNDDK
jgi:hypothetical protein